MSNNNNKMVNYSAGKIYKVEPIIDHDEGDIYIGSTTKKYLCQRMDQHRRNFKRYKNGQYHNITIFNLFEKYGIENCQIILIENVNANSKDELTAKEAFYIKTLKCVNKIIPHRTLKEYREDNKNEIAEKLKKYRKNNKETLSLKYKQYYDENKDIVLMKNKEYREKNKETLSLKNKQYREQNKEQIILKKKEKITCECGVTCRKNDLSRHKKSKFHINYINQLNENVQQIL